MAKYLLVSILFLSTFVCFAQSAIEITDGKSITYEKFEYGFSIDRKSQIKKFLSSKEYDAYDVTVFVRNRSDRDYVRFIYSDGKRVVSDYLAEFNCYNSLEKKDALTGLVLYGKPKTVPITKKEYKTMYYGATPFVYSENEKDEVLVGYTLNSEDVVTASFMVVVKKGEEPKFKVKPYGR